MLNFWNFMICKYKKLAVPKSTRINGRLFIHGSGRGLTIGKNCVINSNENANPVAGGNHVHFSIGPKGRIIIGDDVGISQSQIVSQSMVTIEDHVLIGACCKIWDTDFHSISYNARISKNDLAASKPIFIKEGAFIGACSIILKGVTIGKHSVVGAGSVVTKSVPDGQVWAGNPARFVRLIEE